MNKIMIFEVWLKEFCMPDIIEANSWKEIIEITEPRGNKDHPLEKIERRR